MGTLHSIKQCLLGPAFSPSSDTSSYHPASCDVRLASGETGHHRHVRPEAAHTNGVENAVNSRERPIDTGVLDSIVELLKPVDWASVHTLARHTGLSHEATEAHIEELQRRGVVDIGERLVPPDRRTVAWLTERERALGECP